jgi:UPF0755 protein
LKARSLSLLVGLLFLALVGAIVAAVVIYQGAVQPYKGYSGEEVFVELPPGSSTQAIGTRLVEAGVIQSRMAFRIALWQTGAGRRLKAGEYRFDRAMTPQEAVEKLARGDVYLRGITFPEGLTIREMAALFEAHGFGPAAGFQRAAGNAALIADVDPAARNLEGYLFPETYRLPRRAGADDLVAMMVKRFQQVYAPLEADAAAHGMSARRVVTLASLVEKETAKPEERPLVAAVYVNRLRIGMGLQCDPTVIYALAAAGRYSGNLTHADLAFNSPYNTYRYAGLPPGPIASPGKASLEAAVHPADADYLYFVSRNDGSHEFARDLAAHNRNVQRFQVQYFREKRRADGGRR